MFIEHTVSWHYSVVDPGGRVKFFFLLCRDGLTGRENAYNNITPEVVYIRDVIISSSGMTLNTIIIILPRNIGLESFAIWSKHTALRETIRRIKWPFWYPPKCSRGLTSGCWSMLTTVKPSAPGHNYIIKSLFASRPHLHRDVGPDTTTPFGQLNSLSLLQFLRFSMSLCSLIRLLALSCFIYYYNINI